MRTKAIIIKSQPANEYDKIFVCFTRESGKIRAIAKSILKKNSLQSMHLDSLNLVEFELIDGKNLPIIASAHSENNFNGIKKSLKLLAAAFFFADLIDKSVYENQKDENLWDFLEALLKRLDAAGEENLPEIFREEQRKFLKISGYHPQTGQCALCLAKVSDKNAVDGEWALNVDMGSLICRNCFLLTNQGFLLKSEDLNVLRRKTGEEIFHKKSLDLIFEALIGGKSDSLDFLFRVAKSSI